MCLVLTSDNIDNYSSSHLIKYFLLGLKLLNQLCSVIGNSHPLFALPVTWSAASDCSSDIRWNDSGGKSPVAYLMVYFFLQWACFLFPMTVSTSTLTSGYKYQLNNNFVAKLFVHYIAIC